MKHRGFVAASQRAYEPAGGTKDPHGRAPTAVTNSVRLPLEYNGMLYDSTLFAGLLQRIHDAPGEWQDTNL